MSQQEQQAPTETAYPSNSMPTERDAERILVESLGKRSAWIRRFPTGLANWVYDVVTDTGEKLVVRLARPDLGTFFEGALQWYAPLTQLGVPLPKLHYYELDHRKHGFPAMIMERLAGTDIGDAYASLSL